MRARFWIAPLFVSGTLATTLPAQDNLLKQQEKLQAVAIQKVEANVKEAMNDAQRLSAAGSSVRAAERLRSALRSLDDPILPRAKVEDLRTQLTAALRQTEAGNRPVGTTPTGPTTPTSVTPIKDKEAEAARVKALIDEEKDVRRGIETVSALLRSGETAQAKKEVEQLSKKYPTNSTVVVLPQLVNKTMTLDEVKSVHAKQIEGIRLAMLDLQRLSIIPKYDYELPADWKEITERRKVKLNPKLQAILTALKQPIEIDKTNAPISDVLKALQTAMGQPIVLDKATMQEVGIEASTPTTVSPGTSVTAKTALRMALANHGLTYVIRDNTILVVTREKASQMMETRVYYIGDIVSGIGGGAIRLGTQADEEQTRKNVENLISAIKAVDPASFKGGPGDGRGDVTYHPAAKALIVKASAEVHGMLSNSFSK